MSQINFLWARRDDDAVQACDTSTEELRQEDGEFNASLDYVMSLRLVWTT